MSKAKTSLKLIAVLEGLRSVAPYQPRTVDMCSHWTLQLSLAQRKCQQRIAGHLTESKLLLLPESNHLFLGGSKVSRLRNHDQRRKPASQSL